MDIEKLFDTGMDIADAVNDAVQKGDYSNLSGTIRDKVRDASDNLRGRTQTPHSGSQTGHTSTQVEKEYQYWKEYTEKYRRGPEGTYQKSKQGSYQSAYAGNAARQGQTRQNQSGLRASNQGNYFLQTTVNKDRWLLPVIGWGAGAVTGGSLSVMSMVGTFVTAVMGGQVALTLIPLALTLGFTGFSIHGIKKGLKEKGLISDYYKWGRALGSQEFFDLKEAAAKLGLGLEEFQKRLGEMVKKGFLSIREDAAKTTVMLTDHAYQQYQIAEKSRQDREQTELRRKEENAARYKGLSSQVVEILEDGEEYITRVRWYNDQIPDTEIMSTKLYRLEEICRKIFAQVKSDPTTASGLRRLMNYYLPTTMKLLAAYVDLGNKPSGIQNIENTKTEICQSIDVINDAFEKLLEDMFQNKAWDISSDISVMKNMMAQDGLVDDGYDVS